MSHIRQKSSTVFPDLERIADPEIKQVFSDLFKVLQGAHEDSFDDANQSARWEVDGTETQLVTADEVDMQSKKIINVTDPASAQDAATKAYADAILPASPAQGDIVYYSGAAWVKLTAGTSGYFLKTLGVSNNPLWAAVSGLPASPAQGDVVYYNGTAWVSLVAGTSGQFFKTLGAGANPTWADNIAIADNLDYANQAIILAVNYTERSSGQTTVTKAKEITNFPLKGVVTVAFEYKYSGNALNATAYLYKNGVDQGVSHITGDSTIYVNHYFTNLSVAAGDEIQLYWSVGPSTTAFLRNMRILGQFGEVNGTY